MQLLVKGFERTSQPEIKCWLCAALTVTVPGSLRPARLVPVRLKQALAQ